MGLEVDGWMDRWMNGSKEGEEEVFSGPPLYPHLKN